MIVYSVWGELAREFPLPGSPQEAWSAETVTCSRRGWFGVQAAPERLERKAEKDGTVILKGATSIVIANANGVSQTRVDSIGAIERVVLGGGGAQRPLGVATHIAASDSLLFVGTTDSERIQVLGADGRRRGVIRVPGSVREPTGRHVDAAIEQIVAQIRGGIAQSIETRLKALTPPPRLPRWSGMVVDSEGYLWVTVSIPGDPMADVRVFDSAGVVIATVQLPGSVRLFEVGHDYVLATKFNADVGVAEVVELGLIRSK
ncbi:MAG: hypothetical protein IT361_09050 [Gemmatimonadaceae bacterium]|nr:hypothetical protein [Gemmatimonadaceae bacterium]